MDNRAMPADVKMGKGTGTTIDIAASKIALDHGVIPAICRPAMKMGFRPSPDLLKGVAVGDKVDFEVIVTGSGGEVTAIKKQ